MTADDVARDLCGMIDDVPVAFTFDGVVYQGTRGALITTKRNIDGGMFESPELSITTSTKKVNLSGNLVDRFTGDLPAVTDVIQDVRLPDAAVGSGSNYRVIRTHADEFGIGLQMDLESVKK